jgi:hypothetical protein
MPAPFSTTLYSVPAPQTGTFSLAPCIINAQRQEILVHNADTGIMAAVLVIELSGLGLAMQWFSQPQPLAHGVTKHKAKPALFAEVGDHLHLVCNGMKLRNITTNPPMTGGRAAEANTAGSNRRSGTKKVITKITVTRMTAHVMGDLHQLVNGEPPQTRSSE